VQLEKKEEKEKKRKKESVHGSAQGVVKFQRLSA